MDQQTDIEQKPTAKPRRSLWDKIWKDEQGNAVAWQTPNVPLVGWAVFTCLSLFANRGLGNLFALLGEVSLIIWALLEIFKGSSYFRRLLGLPVLAFAIILLKKTLQGVL